MKLSKRLDSNLEIIKERLGYNITFDLMIREIEIGGRRSAMVFLQNFMSETDTILIMRELQKVERDQIVPNTIEKVLRRVIPFMETESESDMDKIIYQILAGPIVVFIDGQDEAIIIDVRKYPVRGVEEPELERVTRGSREGFVETLVFNVLLIRRRLRDPYLRVEMQQMGERNKSDVAIVYLEGVADPKLIADIKERLRESKEDMLPFGSRALEEYLVNNRYSIIPTIRYTERPDVAAAHLLEGHVILLVDTTPTALILPCTIWHFTQHAEEFFQNPVIGTYLRWVRTFATFMALILTPLWLALFLQKDSLPEWLQFIGPSETNYTVSVILQFFILEVGIDFIRMALIHTPNALATSLGIVGAILLGDLAVSVGLFIPETILYTSLVVIGSFAIPTIEFSLAVRLGRYLLLVFAAIGKLPGFIVGLLVIFLALVSKRSLGVPYLWPLIPFNWEALSSLLFRSPVPKAMHRVNIWPPRKDRT